jgi:5-methylcytosine-specific restriction endonuclease McrA
MRTYGAKYYERRRQALIQELGGVCVQCDSPDALEFDHRDRSQKKIEISSRLKGKRAWLAEELEKLQLLCEGCHRLKTNEELRVPHGGGKAGRKGCRCDPCRLARNRYVRDRYHANKGGVRQR